MSPNPEQILHHPHPAELGNGVPMATAALGTTPGCCGIQPCPAPKFPPFAKHSPRNFSLHIKTDLETNCCSREGRPPPAAAQEKAQNLQFDPKTASLLLRPPQQRHEVILGIFLLGWTRGRTLHRLSRAESQPGSVASHPPRTFFSARTARSLIPGANELI